MVNDLSYEELRLIPALNGKLPQWLSGDEAAGIFNGIVRRTWSENQMQLNVLKSTAAALEAAGCGPVLASGSAAFALLQRPNGPIRPIHDLRLMIPRTQIAQAAAALTAAGWRLSNPLPSHNALDWVPMVHFGRDNLNLMLQWRLLPVPPEQALALENVFLERPATVECCGAPIQIPALEHLALAAVCGRFDFDHDPFPWELDLSLLPLGSVDWRRFAELAASYAPEAFQRVAGLRQLGLALPALKKPKPPGPGPLRLLLNKQYLIWRPRAGRLYRRCLRTFRRPLAQLGIR